MKNLEELKEEFGFQTTSTKWVIPSGEIFKIIGSEVIAVIFKKSISGEWTETNKVAQIIQISDYDPMTLTYLCKYKFLDEDSKNSFREVRIISEGFSFSDPGTTTEIIRFIPYSIHTKMSEDKLFFDRLVKIYSKNDSISIDSLITLSNSKDQIKSLSVLNLGAAVKTIDNNYLWLRIKKISTIHKYKDVFDIRFKTDKKVYTVKNVSKKDKVIKFTIDNEEIGELKFIDLSLVK